MINVPDVLPPKKVLIPHNEVHSIYVALLDLGYSYREDFYFESPASPPESVLKIYKQSLLRDKKVKELLLEYLV